MYHIKNDKRSVRSAELIEEAFIKLLREKNLEDITIKDIHTRAQVGRATFYRLFDSKNDVLLLCFVNTLKRSLKNYEKNNSEENIIHYLIRHLISDETYLLLLNHSSMGILYEGFISHGYFEEKLIETALPIPKSTQAYLSSSLIALLMSILMTWNKRGRIESVDELFEIFRWENETLYLYFS